MEASLLWMGYLVVSLAIYFADELAALAGRGISRVGGVPALPTPEEVALERALEELAGPAGAEPTAQMALLAASPGARLTARLLDVMEGPDASAARRAAQVLFQRQEPASLARLFRYFAKHSSRSTV